MSTLPLTSSLNVKSSWDAGYVLQVTLSNPNSSATTSWSASLALPQGQSISWLWDAQYQVTGQTVAVSNASFNGAIPPGGSVVFGLLVVVVIPPIPIASVSGASGSGSGTSPTVPAAPLLNSITVLSGGSYTVSWNAVSNATSYTLQQDVSSSFSNPVIALQGSGTSKAFSGQPNGTYYYRVFASNASGNGPFSNVQSATVDVPAPTPPVAPVLNPISVSSQGSYTVSWNSVANAASYTLQQDVSSSFPNPVIALQGSGTSKAFAGQPNGTYYFRVRASNAVGNSPFSNVQSAIVQVAPPPPSGRFVEGYWETWNNETVSQIVNMKTDVIDISFAKFTSLGNHKFSISGIESSAATLAQMISATHAAGKKIRVAIGGATYPLNSQLLSSDDAQGMAETVAAFLEANNIDGVDLDIENPTPAAALQIELFQKIRQLIPADKSITYTSATPASTSTPFKQVIQGGHQYLTTINLMAYDVGTGYDYKVDVNNLIAMGVPKSKIVVGLMPGADGGGRVTSLNDVTVASNYTVQNNLPGIMFWSLNRDFENSTGLGASAATNAAYPIIHG